MCGAVARWPIERDESFEVIIAADVEAVDAAEKALALAMGVAAKHERDKVLPAAEHIFHGLIAGKRIPEQGIDGARRLRAREIQSVKSRMMRDDNRPVHRTRAWSEVFFKLAHRL